MGVYPVALGARTSIVPLVPLVGYATVVVESVPFQYVVNISNAVALGLGTATVLSISFVERGIVLMLKDEFEYEVEMLALKLVEVIGVVVVDIIVSTLTRILA